MGRRRDSLDSGLHDIVGCLPVAGGERNLRQHWTPVTAGDDGDDGGDGGDADSK